MDLSVTKLICWLLAFSAMAIARKETDMSRARNDRRDAPVCGVDSLAGSPCPPSFCCSKSGFCDKSGRHCGPGCQMEYSGDSCDKTHNPKGPWTWQVARNHVGNVPYGSAITACTKAGVIALTFDDGPLVNSTERLLDLLAKQAVRATFFVTGANLDKGSIEEEATGYPAILRRMHRSGHQIGSHTWSHPDLDRLADASSPQLARETMFIEMALRNIFGWFPTYMRPPRLRCETRCLESMAVLGYHVIKLNLNPKDYRGDLAKSKAVVKKALSRGPMHMGYIVEAHDTLGDLTLELASYTIHQARKYGWQFVTVGECLGDPKDNWYRQARQKNHGNH